MPKGSFLPSEFVPTKFSTAADKADFGNIFLHFIDSEWKRPLFTKRFYERLSNTFGHIAHYDLPTFYDTWFTSDADRMRFLCHALDWPCWGDPEFTFCDVERVIQREILRRNYLAQYELRAAETACSAEMEMLRRLEEKYRPARLSSTEESSGPATRVANEPATIARAVMPMQASLFNMIDFKPHTCDVHEGEEQ